MNPVDDEILEVLDEQGAGTPSNIAEQTDNASNYVGDRLSVLVSAGLANKPSRGFYTISDRGQSYLSGALDAGDINRPE